MPANITPKGLPFKEAIEYWQNRVPTTRRIEFDGQTEMVRDRAFIITKLTKLQMVDRVHKEILRGLETGVGTAEIVRTLKKGKQGIPLSQLHLETIVRTNYALSYSAGRWTQIQRTKERRPYLEYLCSVDGRERPSHKVLNGKIYPVDDPFWKLNFPPNGFNCRCDVATVSQREVDNIIERTGVDPVVRTTNPIALDNNFNFIPGTPPAPDLTKYEDVYRESFLNDIAHHFGVDAAGEVRMKKYFNAGDVQDAILLHKVQPYDQKAYAKLVKDMLTTPQGQRQNKGLIMMAGRLPVEVRKYLDLNVSVEKPKFTLITIDDFALMHMQRPAKNPNQLLNMDEVLDIPNILGNKKSRWYEDPRDESLVVFSDLSDTEVIKISIHTHSNNGTPYVVSAGKVPKKAENTGFKWIK